MDKSGGVYRLFVSNNEVCLTEAPARQGGGKRGKVRGMTRKSASAMRRFLNSVLFDTATFVTLTYRYNQRAWAEAYKHLRSWYKRLCTLCGGVCMVWRQELQARGAIHFHCFLFDAPTVLSAEVLRDEWLDVTGQAGDFAARKHGVDVKHVDALRPKDAGVICAYLVKYATKEGDPAGGRQWGILGRKYARTTGKKAIVTEFEGVALFEYFRREGFAEFQVDGGIRCARAYLGHIGVASRGGVLDRFSENVQVIGGILEGIK